MVGLVAGPDRPPARPGHHDHRVRLGLPHALRRRGAREVPRRGRGDRSRRRRAADLRRELPPHAVRRRVAEPDGRREGRRLPVDPGLDRPGLGGMVRRRSGQQPPEVGLPAQRALRLHLRDHRRGTRADRRPGGPGHVHRADLRGDPHRGAGARHVRPPPRRRRHVLDRAAGDHQPGRGHRPAPDHRRPVAARLLRRHRARGDARRDRRARERRAMQRAAQAGRRPRRRARELRGRRPRRGRPRREGRDRGRGHGRSRLPRARPRRPAPQRARCPRGVHRLTLGARGDPRAGGRLRVPSGRGRPAVSRVLPTGGQGAVRRAALRALLAPAPHGGRRRRRRGRLRERAPGPRRPPGARPPGAARAERGAEPREPVARAAREGDRPDVRGRRGPAEGPVREDPDG